MEKARQVHKRTDIGYMEKVRQVHKRTDNEGRTIIHWFRFAYLSVPLKAIFCARSVK